MHPNKELFVVPFALLVFLVLPVSVAFAEGSKPFGGTEHSGSNATVTFSHTAVVDFGARKPAEREHVSVDPVEPPCLREGVISATANDDGTFDDNYGCVLYAFCGGERIDDIYTGVISSSEASGAYAEFLHEFDNLVGATGPNTGADINVNPGGVDSLNDTLLDNGLTETADPLLLPVFYYCREGADGPISTDPTTGFDPFFGWDTDITVEYDLPTVRTTLVDSLLEAVTEYPPRAQMTPPIEHGLTIVNFPSWFWIDLENNPSGAHEVLAISDMGTINLEGRIELTHVEWQLGDTTLPCTLEQMEAWNPNLHPFDDQPFCSKIFTTIGGWDLSYTAHFMVQERITSRRGRNGTPLTTGWQPHPTTPNFDLPVDLGTYQVCRILSVNTAITNDADSTETTNHRDRLCTN